MADRVPVAGARLVLFEPGLAAVPLAEATTDAAGVARFSSLVHGRYRVVARHPGFARLETEVAVVADEQRIELSLERGAHVGGSVVTAGGEPAGGATVQLMRQGSVAVVETATTAADGGFRFGRLGLGVYRVRAFDARHRPTWLEGVRVGTHGDDVQVQVRLQPGRVLAGRVVDRAGRPLADAYVGTSDEGSTFVATDAEGRFELGGLGDEAVNLFATKLGYGPEHLRGLRPGARGIELVLGPAAKLSGRIEGLLDGGRAMASVCHHDEHFERELCVARQLVTRGDFTIENLPVGRFELVLEATGYDTVRKRVQLESEQNFSLGVVELSPAP